MPGRALTRGRTLHGRPLQRGRHARGHAPLRAGQRAGEPLAAVARHQPAMHAPGCSEPPREAAPPPRGAGRSRGPPRARSRRRRRGRPLHSGDGGHRGGGRTLATRTRGGKCAAPAQVHSLAHSLTSHGGNNRAHASLDTARLHALCPSGGASSTTALTLSAAWTSPQQAKHTSARAEDDVAACRQPQSRRVQRRASHGHAPGCVATHPSR